MKKNKIKTIFKMSRIYKICVVNNLTENTGEVFAIKPYLESFDSFKDEIYIRMPELKTQPMKIYYQGKCVRPC